MAERRMFAKTIVLSDAFLDMPLGARCLYMTMGMLADDDGFVNAPKSIMRQCGATEDDLKVLLAKKFVLPFESGVIVIKHWRINNYLQKDRIQPTKYQEELALLELEDNGAYTKQSEACIHDSVYIDKNSIDKNSIDKNTTYEHDFDRFWSAYPKKKNKGQARTAFQKAIKKTSAETMINAVEKQKKSNSWKKENGKYIPYPSTWLNAEAWEDEESVSLVSSDQQREEGKKQSENLKKLYEKLGMEWKDDQEKENENE